MQPYNRDMHLLMQIYYKEVNAMTKYREILRLIALGLSQRNIIQSIGVSQKTIVKVQRRAQEMHLSWPLDESLTDAALEKLMFPKQSTLTSSNR